jgi:hypothetical protein
MLKTNELKLALALLCKGIPEYPEVRLVITCHDELVVECLENQAGR